MEISGFPARRPAGAASERERLARASILVLGDATLERSLDGELEGGFGGGARAATLRLRTERAEPGAGAAVVRALAALGVASAFICVLGDDLAGAQLTQLIGEQRNVEPWLLIDGAKSTVTETRYRIAGETVFRTVREDIVETPPDLRARMLRIAVETLSLTAVALLTDRDHGTLDAITTAEIIAAAVPRPPPPAGLLEDVHRSLASIAGIDRPTTPTEPLDPEPRTAVPRVRNRACRS